MNDVEKDLEWAKQHSSQVSECQGEAKYCVIVGDDDPDVFWYSSRGKVESCIARELARETKVSTVIDIAAKKRLGWIVRVHLEAEA